MDIAYGVRIHTSVIVDGRKVTLPMYYVGCKGGQAQTCARPHNAMLMTEALAEVLVTRLKSTGHKVEICELLADEMSTIHDSLEGIGHDPPELTVAEFLKLLPVEKREDMADFLYGRVPCRHGLRGIVA